MKIPISESKPSSSNDSSVMDPKSNKTYVLHFAIEHKLINSSVILAQILIVTINCKS